MEDMALGIMGWRKSEQSHAILDTVCSQEAAISDAYSKP